MEHVVFFPAHDGTPAFRRVASLEDAVRLVEHLRNVEAVSEVSVHALTEVPLAFKTWYRVEVPGAGEAPVAEAPVAEPEAMMAHEAPQAPESLEAVEVAAPVVVAEVPEQPVVALAASNGQTVAGPSSLGFFAS
jgi:hypothetical protein